MAVKERVFDVDEFWRFVCQPENANRRVELINRELVEMPQPCEEHGFIAGEIYHHLRLFDPRRELGIPTVDTGCYSQEDRSTVPGPDVAFRLTADSLERPHKKWAPTMPDIAVEIKSPSNTLAELRQKAAIYLERETQLVWILVPESRSAEVWRLTEDGDIETEFISDDGALSGENVLPGFKLELAALFSP